MDAKAAERAKVRIARMEQEAEEFTKALGLPPEATYTVMAAMYKVKTSSAVKEAQPEAGVSNDTRLKELVYRLGEEFISIQAKEQLATFQTLQEQLKTLPLETLSERPEQRLAAFQGIGLTGGQRFQRLLSIIAAISWAIVNYPTLSKADPEQIRDTIAKEAEARGCSRVLSHALARYLQTRAPYSDR